MASRRWRSVAVLVAIIAVLTFANTALGNSWKSSSRAIDSQSGAADLHDEISRASLEYEAARIAPATSVPAGAPGAAWTAANALPRTGGTWSEVTNKPYDSDDPAYRDPVISNSGGGSGLVTGRMTALAVQSNGTVWAGAADGGVWKSTDQGAHWTPTFDNMPSLSVGALAIAPDNSVWVGTGENNTAFENYRGAGVFRTTNGGASWTLVGDNALDGATIGKLAFANGNVFAATSRGLWKHSATDLTASWVKVFDATSFGYQAIPYGLSMVNDVVVRPGTNGQYLVANMSWRNGAAYNGLYVSTDGGNSFARVKAGGAINDGDVGSTALAYSADGSKLYAVVESPFQITHFTQNGGTVLQGVYVSNTGNGDGPWNKIAESSKLAGSGSALPRCCSKGYLPGVQAWYNRFVGVDPLDSDHVYVGLEEVFETTNGGSSWFAVGPYWNFGMPCSANGLDSCPKTTHPDQHAVAFGNGTVYVGNDGGVWRRSTSDTGRVDGWTDLNATLRTLQYYYAGAGAAPGGFGVWGGLQDNGGSLMLPGAATMVSPFGGDGGDVYVDPTDYKKTINEYVYLDMFLTTNAGASDGSTNAWREISPSCGAFTYTPNPCDPNPRFIAPFRADVANGAHWVAGGQYVWDNGGKGWDTTCGATSCDFKIVYNTGAGNSTTAIAVNGTVTYAAWCGPTGCNPRVSSTTGSGFRRGIATNYGGTWHELDLTTAGVPGRYVNSVTVDATDPGTVYAVFGGYSRRWVPTGGTGHIWKSTDGGATWSDISGNLPDAPFDDIVLKGNTMYAASDVGVFTATVGSTTWSRLGTGTGTTTGLPNAAVNDLTFSPNKDYLIAATHGRGIWKIAIP